jgi:magnesium-transporting ATPase (P-type)
MERAEGPPTGSLDDMSLVDSQTVAKRLGVNPATGLSDEEATRRLVAEGPNELREKKAVPVWPKVLAQFQGSKRDSADLLSLAMIRSGPYV